MFQFDKTLEKYCILIKKLTNEDGVLLGVSNQNELYFYLHIERLYITSKRTLNNCYNYKKVKKIEKYISF